MIRAVILAATAAILAVMYRDQPKPVQTVEVKYCQQVGYRAAFKDDNGKWIKVWVNGWGLCKDMDRFEFI